VGSIKQGLGLSGASQLYFWVCRLLRCSPALLRLSGRQAHLAACLAAHMACPSVPAASLVWPHLAEQLLKLLGHEAPLSVVDLCVRRGGAACEGRCARAASGVCGKGGALAGVRCPILYGQIWGRGRRQATLLNSPHAHRYQTRAWSGACSVVARGSWHAQQKMVMCGSRSITARMESFLRCS
jgi:hypothetical protein